MNNIRTARNEGFEANRSGEPRAANPHPRCDSIGSPFSAWDSGWADSECDRWQHAKDWDRANA
jgi:hypothetical protein